MGLSAVAAVAAVTASPGTADLADAADLADGSGTTGGAAATGGAGGAAATGGAGGAGTTDGAAASGTARAVGRDVIATAVRYTLQVLAERAKGNTVEVRVPPFAAVQCIEGPGHTRGTPPNVVEMDAPTWLALVTGTLDWVSGVEAGRIHASGQRADLRGYVPLAGLGLRPGS